MRLIDIFNDYLKIFFLNKKKISHLYDFEYVKKIKAFSEDKKWKTQIKNCIQEIKLESIKNGLDIGCNAGVGTEFVSKLLKVNMYGVDTSSVAIDFANKYFKNSKNNYLHYAGDYLPFKDNSFDFVCSFHVIGHVLNSDNFIYEAKRVLKKKKKILIITPNAYYKIVALLDSLISLYKPDKTVVKYWFPKSLKSLLLKNGFDEVEIMFVGEMPIILRFFNFLSIFRSRLVITATKSDM